MQLEAAKPGVSHVAGECLGCHKKVAAYEPHRVEWRKRPFHNQRCLDQYLAVRPIIVRAKLKTWRENRRLAAQLRRLMAAVEFQRYCDEQRRRLPAERRREPLIAAARLARYAAMKSATVVAAT
ncbi:MAG TPA: hypothetical protein VMC43_01165 [Candidatus Paceibacterota bacterium]|nr:hypothetical protein [Candidatus Paceibacterota bacterium]